MGGDQERVEVHLIAHPDDDQTEARRLLTEQFATFNAGKAQCFLASDREHLLAVIEAGFGDFYDFNRLARNLLASRLHNPPFPLASQSISVPQSRCELLGTVRAYLRISQKLKIIRRYADFHGDTPTFTEIRLGEILRNTEK